MVTASTKANTAYASGVMFLDMNPMAPNRSPWTRSYGLAAQVSSRLNTPTTITLASAMNESFTTSQRVRETLWFQTSRCVPPSSSRVMSGAPQKRPMSAGTEMSRTLARKTCSS